PLSSATHATKWRPTRTGLRFRELIVYSRDPCPLCDEAIELLTAYQRWLPHQKVINVDTDPRLVEKYGLSVPVIVCDGKVRFRGHVAPELLQRLIEGTPPL
ncbi:MAG TPA: glutaredoxin family protein, partial [Planctomycetaceae bacterium]|nr:glutaredoxin family protein [Planctomycetaceae bacterium]